MFKMFFFSLCTLACGASVQAGFYDTLSPEAQTRFGQAVFPLFKNALGKTITQADQKKWRMEGFLSFLDTNNTYKNLIFDAVSGLLQIEKEKNAKDYLNLSVKKLLDNMDAESRHQTVIGKVYDKFTENNKPVSKDGFLSFSKQPSPNAAQKIKDDKKTVSKEGLLSFSKQPSPNAAQKIKDDKKPDKKTVSKDGFLSFSKQPSLESETQAKQKDELSPDSLFLSFPTKESSRLPGTTKRPALNPVEKPQLKDRARLLTENI